MKKLALSFLLLLATTSAFAGEVIEGMDARGRATHGAVAEDFSQVTSREAAQKLVAEGKLVKILLFPAEFGGQDVPPNVVYVPPGARGVQEQIVGTITRFAEKGLVDKLNVNAEYKGESFVPSKIHMKATDSSGKHGSFEPTIDIW